MKVDLSVVEEAAKELYIRALKILPPDIKRGFDRLAGSESDATAKGVLGTMITNIQVAERTDNLKRADLYVSQAFVDQGVTIRRIRPRARGGWGRILKRSSHITVVVEPRTERATRGQATTRSKEK